MLENPVDVLGLAVGRQAHDLVLARVDPETGVVGEGRVEQTEAVREVELLLELQSRCRRRLPSEAVAHSPTPSMVRTAARSKGDGIEGRCGVRLVMLRKEDLPLVPRQSPADQVFHPELLLQPQRHRLVERRQAPGRELEVGLEEALELQPRLVVEGDRVELGGRDAPLPEAVVDCRAGEAVIVLLAREALLLGRADDGPTVDQARGGVVIERGESQYLHCLSVP